MATKQDVDLALELFHKHKVKNAFHELVKKEIGYFAAIKYLNDVNKQVNAKDISNALEISTARTAILLKKLENKKFVTKTNSSTDARSVVVSLTDEGRRCADDLRGQMIKSMEKVVDEIGLQELERLFETLEKIEKIMKENMLKQTEDCEC